MIKELYISKSSLIHGLDFWTKFLCLLLILPLTAFLSPTDFLPPVVLVFVTILFLSKISFLRFWQMTKLYIISITAGVIILSLAFSLGTWQERVIQGLILSVRFILLISFGIFFSVVTNPIEIPAGFLRAKIPHKYGVTLMVGFRMMPLLSQKIKSIIDAQRARGAEIKFSLRKLNKLGTLLVSLMVPILYSTLETSVRLSDALISRGYNPEGEITVSPGKLSKKDYIFLLVSLIFLALVVIKP